MFFIFENIFFKLCMGIYHYAPSNSASIGLEIYGMDSNLFSGNIVG
jgi:hypothetical protein